jgi:histidinol-phosphatase (PHP family)
LDGIGFSSHAPLPFTTDWTMPKEKLPAYLSEIKRLKAQYRAEINVYCGLEIDYLPGEQAPDTACFTGLELDYTIGAVHYIGRDRAGTPWSIDGTDEEFKKALHTIFNGNIQDLVKKYYALVRDMALNHRPDIIAHLDVVKKNNRAEEYFLEEESWYRQAVVETLQVLKQQNLVVEVNTGGLNRKRADSFYPSQWILEKCLALHIPVTLASDAHAPEQLIGHFKKAAQILNRIGFEELSVLTLQGWQRIALVAPC